MNPPRDIALSPQEGKALIERLEQETWTPQDRLLLVQRLRMYWGLMFAL